MKKLFTLISLFTLSLCGFAADEVTQMNEAYHMYVIAENAKAGSPAELILNMKNRNAIGKWQCTLALPEGVTFSSVVPFEEEGRYPDGFNPQITSTPNDDNSVTLFCYGTEELGILGNDGAVAIVTVNIDANVNPGEYEGVVRNIILYEPNDAQHDYIGEKKFTWTIEPGDVVEEATITFDLNGAPGEYAPITAEVGSPVGAPDDPEWEGYTFLGWNPPFPETMPEGGLTCVAQWQANEYSLTFLFKDDPEALVLRNAPQTFGTTIVPPDAPENEGFDFAGWYVRDETGIVVEMPETMPAHDLIVFAQWDTHYYNIDFYLDKGGELYEGQEAAFGEEIPLPADPQEREGYIFTGWVLEDGSPMPETMPSHDLVLYANWELMTYTLAFIIDGEVLWSDNVAFGADVAPLIPEVPEKPGYVFSGWYEEIPQVMPAGEVIITGSYIQVVEFFTPTQQYTLFSSPKNIDFTGSDVKAYVAVNYNKALNCAMLEPVTTVPAGTGVLLVAEVGQTYMIPFADNEDATVIEVNLFKAMVEPAWISPEVPYETGEIYHNYVLNEDANKFKPLTDNGIQGEAQSAYLQVPCDDVTEGELINIGLRDTADGIQGIKSVAGENAIFDLQGRRVSQTQKGIYIVNGKKVLR